MTLSKDYIEMNICVADVYRDDEYTRQSLETAVRDGAIDIEPTGTLEKELDKLRATRGYKPFFADLPKDQLDLDGWYNTTLIIEGEAATKIIAYATYSNDDDREPYEIPLDRETGINVYAKILREVGEILGN